MPSFNQDRVSAKSELRKCPMASLYNVISILEIDGWKTLMLNIPKQLDSAGSSKEFKYTAEHVRLIEQAAVNTRRKCTEILFDEWGTSGRVRPTLQTLKDLLVDTLQFRAADELAVMLNDPKPRRPDEGPAAPIETDLNKILEEELLESHLNKMETISVMSETCDPYQNNLDKDIVHLPNNGQISSFLNHLVGDSKSDNNLVPLPETVEVIDVKSEKSTSNINENSTHSVKDSAAKINTGSLNVPDLSGLQRKEERSEYSESNNQLWQSKTNDNTSSESELSESYTSETSTHL